MSLACNIKPSDIVLYNKDHQMKTLFTLIKNRFMLTAALIALSFLIYSYDGNKQDENAQQVSNTKLADSRLIPVSIFDVFRITLQ